MATVRVMYWKDIPYAVRAQDAGGRANKQLPRSFEAAVDAAAMADGATAPKDYQAGFRWGPSEEREGTTVEVAQAVYDELLAAYPPARLAKLVRREPAEA